MNDSTFPAPPPVNPYAPPKADITPGVGISDEAEVTRRELLNHEVSIKSIGTLYLLSAFGAAIGTLVFLGMLVSGNSAGGLGGITMVLLFALLTLAYGALGKGLRNLNAGIRIWVTILAVLGLLGFPLGTLINGYILYLLHGEKGKRVMTPEYQQIVQQTPHIQYKTPLWLKILLLLLIVGLAALLIIAVMSS